MRLALYQPDIPQNTGTMMRLCACMNVPMDIIEPCGFALSDKNLKRAGMDYLEHLDLTRHMNWQQFCAAETTKRIVLLTTRAETRFTDFAFQAEDTLLLGRESGGHGFIGSLAANGAVPRLISERFAPKTVDFPQGKAPNMPDSANGRLGYGRRTTKPAQHGTGHRPRGRLCLVCRFARPYLRRL
jgi:tRNA (cytidine(34)-2'-O)-methyltransferase